MTQIPPQVNGNSSRFPSAQTVREALSLVRSGTVFDLDIGRFPGMPHHPAQPGFDVATYRSPRGLRNARVQQNGTPYLDEDNFGFVLVSSS